LIALAIIGKLNLLEKLYEEIVVPFAVYKEVTEKEKPFSKELRLFLSNRTKQIANRLAVEVLISDIGIGESESIVLALEEKPDLVLIDDLKARKFAKMYGLEIIGTMGILLKAKKKGLITEIKPLITELLSNGIRIGNRIIEMTLEAGQEL
jgi:predicted nucleic acid-binding protein